ncbi:DUF3089 domain-containing protein [Nocardia sp. NPDC005366]|uniref:DUF3089 domain-containing protein n=1 Tax=Nocardia sp. NPDC005366 TaxID=3156878 RepID=UPI0033B31D4B
MWKISGSRRVLRRHVLAAGVFVGLLAAGVAPVHAEPETEPQIAWLCRPGLTDNPCGQGRAGELGDRPQGRFPDGRMASLQVTALGPGTAPATTKAADVDCFYVYGTTDLLPNPIEGTVPQTRPEHVSMILEQAGPLLGRCRMFAPLYRQDTFLQLAVNVVTRTDSYEGPGFDDVVAAFDDYWSHDNLDPVTGKRRGIVLLGHSQGAVAIQNLARARFDGNPETTAQLVSALPIGGKVRTPADRLAGGGTDPESTFQHLPLCSREIGAPIPIGCVIAYSTYAADSPTPGPGSMVWNPGSEHRTACVNPATLLRPSADNSAVPISPIVATRELTGNNDGPDLPGGFVRYPNALSASCRVATDVDGGTSSWLQVHGDLSALLGDAAHPLAIPGSGDLGLHAADITLTLGDLTDLVTAQAARWHSTRP